MEFLLIFWLVALLLAFLLLGVDFVRRHFFYEKRVRPFLVELHQNGVAALEHPFRGASQLSWLQKLLVLLSLAGDVCLALGTLVSLYVLLAGEVIYQVTFRHFGIGNNEHARCDRERQTLQNLLNSAVANEENLEYEVRTKSREIKDQADSIKRKDAFITLLQDEVHKSSKRNGTSSPYSQKDADFEAERQEIRQANCLLLKAKTAFEKEKRQYEEANASDEDEKNDLKREIESLRQSLREQKEAAEQDLKSAKSKIECAAKILEAEKKSAASMLELEKESAKTALELEKQAGAANVTETTSKHQKLLAEKEEEYKSKLKALEETKNNKIVELEQLNDNHSVLLTQFADTLHQVGMQFGQYQEGQTITHVDFVEFMNNGFIAMAEQAFKSEIEHPVDLMEGLEEEVISAVNSTAVVLYQPAITKGAVNVDELNECFKELSLGAASWSAEKEIKLKETEDSLETALRQVKDLTERPTPVTPCAETFALLTMNDNAKLKQIIRQKDVQIKKFVKRDLFKSYKLKVAKEAKTVVAATQDSTQVAAEQTTELSSTELLAQAGPVAQNPSSSAGSDTNQVTTSESVSGESVSSESSSEGGGSVTYSEYAVSASGDEDEGATTTFKPVGTSSNVGESSATTLESAVGISSTDGQGIDGTNVVSTASANNHPAVNFDEAVENAVTQSFQHNPVVATTASAIPPTTTTTPLTIRPIAPPSMAYDPTPVPLLSPTSEAELFALFPNDSN